MHGSHRGKIGRACLMHGSHSGKIGRVFDAWVTQGQNRTCV